MVIEMEYRNNYDRRFAGELYDLEDEWVLSAYLDEDDI
jgi:hypothetical protein